jgi:hypothetical protein
MAKKSTAIVPTMLRIREELRKRLEREAKKRDHSLNAEMAERLEKSFSASRDGAILDMLVRHDDVSAQLLRDIADQIAKHPDWSTSEEERKELLTGLTFSIHGKEPQGEPQPGDDE